MIVTGLSKTAENASFFVRKNNFHGCLCADLSLVGELILDREVLEVLKRDREWIAPCQ